MIVVVVVMFMCVIRIVFNAIASIKHRPIPSKLAAQLEMGRMVKYVEWLRIKRRGEASKNAIVYYERAIERVNRVCSIYVYLQLCVPILVSN